MRRPVVLLHGRLSLLTLLVVGAGCSSPTEPAVRIARQAEPFYYYLGRPIALRVDSTRLTVATTLPMPRAARDMLAPAGVRVDSAGPMGEPEHWVVWLAPRTSPAQAARAAVLLRVAEGVTFASTGYRLAEGGAPLLLVNRLGVQFKAGTTRAERERLNSAVGMSEDRLALDGVWWLRYPPHSAYTPLEIAAFYDRHPLVAWADPDKMGEFVGSWP